MTAGNAWASVSQREPAWASMSQHELPSFRVSRTPGRRSRCSGSRGNGWRSAAASHRRRSSRDSLWTRHAANVRTRQHAPSHQLTRTAHNTHHLISSHTQLAARTISSAHTHSSQHAPSHQLTRTAHSTHHLISSHAQLTARIISSAHTYSSQHASSRQLTRTAHSSPIGQIKIISTKMQRRYLQQLPWTVII